MPKTVMFVSELGGGRGHVTRLNTIASAAKEKGLRTILAHCSGERLHQAGSTEHFDALIDGPPFPRLRNPPSNLEVNGLASNLAKVGFIDRRVISSQISQWHTVFKSHRPTIIVGDFAPFARVASLGRLPFVMAGSGYTIPSSKGLLPFALPVMRLDPSELSRRLFSQVNAALKETNSVEIANLSECLRGDRNLVACLPFLDPVADRPEDEYIGPLEKIPDQMPAQDQARRAYAYLHSIQQRDRITLKKLAQSGYKVDLYCDDPKYESIPEICRLRKPLNLKRLSHTYNLVFHQAGLGLSTSSLLAGIPQILAPRYVESYITAVRLQEHAFGAFAVYSEQDDSVGIGSVLRALFATSAVMRRELNVKRAQSWAQGKDWNQQLSSVFDLLL